MKFDIAATTILLTFCVAVVVITDRVEGMIDFGSTISNIRTFRKIRESTGVKLIMKMRNGEFENAVKSLEPTATVNYSYDVNDDLIIDYGAKAALSSNSEDRNLFVRATYGSAATTSGWDTAIQGNYNLVDKTDLELSLDVDNEEKNLSASIHTLARKTKEDGFSFGVKNIEGNYARETNLLNQPGKFTITPNYDVTTKTPDIHASYESILTKVGLTFTAEEKLLNLQRKLPWKNTLGVQLTDQGELFESMMVDYHRDVNDNGATLNINYQSHKATVVWSDGSPWELKASANVDKTGFSDVDIHVGSHLEF